MATSLPNASLRVVIIDDDAIFRAGVGIWLREQTVEIMAEAADPSTMPVDLAPPDVILYGLNHGAPAVLPAIQALQALTSRPILGLGPMDTAVALRAQQAGARGYWVKGSDPQTLLTAVRRVGAGRDAWSIPYWQSNRANNGGWFNQWRSRLYTSGVGQIEAAIADIDVQLTASMPALDRAIAAGHRRELQAARGLVNWLLAPRVSGEATSGESDMGASVERSPSSEAAATPQPAVSSSEPFSGSAVRLRSAAAPTGSDRDDLGGALVPGGIQTTLLETLDTKLQFPLRNQTGRPLEIDILQEDRRRELLYRVLQSLRSLLAELQQTNARPVQLLDQARLLQDLWQRALTQFFGKYYVVSVDGVELEVVPLLLREADRIVADLDTIPGVTDLLAHMLFQDPLLVDGVPHAVGTATAMARAEQLLDNLVVRVANAVVQPMLNQLADVEVIKQNFYSRRLVSSRDIAQFRNNLSWHYRLAYYLYEPLDIFESQIRLLRLGPVGIQEQTVYAPRRSELEALTGVQFWVTLVLELRDALAPRFRALVSWLGKLVVYVLTEVLGRGIGLIGRGVLRGIGSAWQDVRVSRDGSKKTVSDHRR